MPPVLKSIFIFRTLAPNLHVYCKIVGITHSAQCMRLIPKKADRTNIIIWKFSYYHVKRVLISFSRNLHYQKRHYYFIVSAKKIFLKYPYLWLVFSVNIYFEAELSIVKNTIKYSKFLSRHRIMAAACCFRVCIFLRIYDWLDQSFSSFFSFCIFFFYVHFYRVMGWCSLFPLFLLLKVILNRLE